MWNVLIPAVADLLGKLIPDPQARADAQVKLAQLAQAGELAQLDAAVKLAGQQAAINEAEAKSSDPYTSRARPTIIYVMGAALAFQYVLNPLILWVFTISGSTASPPDVGLDEHLWELMTGILGMSAWRMIEKVKGAAS